MAVLLDTSVLVQLERERRRDLRRALDDVMNQGARIASITASELLHGVHRADTVHRRVRREHFVEAILSAVMIYPFDFDVARVHSGIWADLASTGKLIGPHDLIIAATAVAHDLPLATYNAKEFRRIEGLELVEV